MSMKNQTVGLTFCILLVSFTTALSQGGASSEPGERSPQTSTTKVDLSRKIKMERDSKPEEVILPIGNDVKRFGLFIHSSVDAGDLKIELYDPKGNSQGSLVGGTQLTGPKSERVNSSISKSVDHPQSGDWKIRISPVQVTGTVVIETTLSY